MHNKQTVIGSTNYICLRSNTNIVPVAEYGCNTKRS